MEEAIPVLSNLIHRPVIELPDIVSIPESIKDNLFGELVRNRAGNRFIIGIWGSLEQRKGTTEFLQMCLKLPSEKYFFVMGGRIHYNSWPEKDKKILQQSNAGNLENLLIHDQWLTDDELLSGMFSCDLIFAAYPVWKFSSGIVGKAAAIGTPILVNDGFLMARRVKDYNIGFVKQAQADVTKWVSNNIAEIKKLRNSSSFKEGCLKYCEKYSYEQWCKALAQLIEPQK
jgi:glycosyltransferase involved in cell wall biosynthesis